MVNSRRYVIDIALVAVALAATLALAPAAGAHAQAPVPPAPPPIPPVPPVPPVPTLPSVPEVPGVPPVPQDPGELVDLVTPLSSQLMLSARPRRAGSLPVTFRVSGWLMPPKPFRGMADFFRKSLGIDLGMCSGRVTTAFRASGRTIATRRASVSTTCRFTSRITIRSRRRIGGARSMRATARFAGNSLLAPARHSIALRLR